ncbi:Glycosyltransferase involved in cell wall bisynthesis [Vibrio xiamenensis]|uniref:Glycosyltransferase involved in cell wall bisynthesis n=1 Tax=Vibrio xiamenensis TaxID=861298 RepID=A0A1G8GHC3_9VIBR|nr:glycosyltransferase family 2 protein [Vibrio xiamenensis]SDH93750.1 Glycosyltransferase involved in cell wall bisynthesis [Vibrio xiamenensis]
MSAFKSQFLDTNATTPKDQDHVTLSVVAPYFKKTQALPIFHQRLTDVLDTLNIHSEIIYIDDGSSDESTELVKQFSANKSRIRCISLSRNFGKESAMSAGLAHTQGDAVILLDADLQDPPELIPQMLEAWSQGYDVVNMQRSVRHGESWFKRFSAASFYKILNFVSKMNVPENVGDFRLLSKTVVSHINSLPEKNRYMKGIFSWPGFKQTTLQFERDPRLCGITKWNYVKLFSLAMDGLTSFSISPLRIATVLGGLTAFAVFAFTVFTLLSTLINGAPLMDVSWFIVAQFGFGGIQLLCIGLLGEYVGRIFVETKQRPVYLVDTVFDKPAKANTPTHEATI